MPPKVLILKARNIGMTQMFAALRRELKNVDTPLPWWMEVKNKAVQTHRAIDMQVMLATGNDIERRKKENHES